MERVGVIVIFDDDGDDDDDDRCFTAIFVYMVGLMSRATSKGAEVEDETTFHAEIRTQVNCYLRRLTISSKLTTRIKHPVD